MEQVWHTVKYWCGLIGSFWELGLLKKSDFVKTKDDKDEVYNIISVENFTLTLILLIVIIEE